jgi:hypothetical protein
MYKDLKYILVLDMCFQKHVNVGLQRKKDHINLKYVSIKYAQTNL